MKKEAVTFLFLIFLIPFISAQFTFTDVLSFIDSQIVFLLVVFGILGLLLKTILDRYPAFRGTTSGIISILLSIGMTYGINKWVNVNDLFLGFGFSGDLLPYLLLALLVVLVFSLFMFKWKALLIFGLLLILISLFTDLVAEKEIVLGAGIALVLISLFWWFWWWRRKKKGLVPANLKNVKNIQNVINGMPRLIVEAQTYRKLADRQPNSKMYRNWANFIHYLKTRGYGNNEREICQRMMVSSSDISKVVKRYIL